MKFASKVSMFKRPSVIVATAILLATGVVKWASSLSPAEQHVPLPAQPVPNARTEFDIAANTVPVGLGNIYYGDSIPPDVSSKDRADPQNPYYSPSFQTEKFLIKQAQPAFKTLELGLTHPYGSIPTLSFVDNLPNIMMSKYRNLARCLDRASRICGKEGDWSDALRYRVDAIDLGVNVGHGSNLLSFLVGSACESIGQRGIDTVITHVSSVQAIQAANRILAADAQSVPASQTLLTEKWTTQRCLLSLFKTKNWRQDMLDDFSTSVTASSTSLEIPSKTLLWAMFEPPFIFYKKYTRYMDASIAYCKLPWSEQLQRPFPAPDMDLLCQLVEPVYEKLTFVYLRDSAFRRLEAVQLALQAYQLDNSRYPASLRALVPHYLPIVPVDPFSTGQPLIYKTAGHDTYLLYSVGPDTKDDHGRAITNTSPVITPLSPMRRRVYDSTITGDIVAGINN